MNMTGLDTFLGVIEVLKDEKKYGPLLDEMRQLRDDTRADLDELDAKAKEIAKDRAAAEVARNEMAAKHNEIHQKLLPREMQVQDDAKIIQKKQEKLDAEIEEHKQNARKVSSEIADRLNFATGREAQIKADQKKLDEDRKKVDALKTEYETKLGVLKRAVA